MVDPIRSSFVDVVKSRTNHHNPDQSISDYDLAICSEADWEYLKRLLLRRGTVAPHELSVLNTIWDNACESARAVGNLGGIASTQDGTESIGSRKHSHAPPAILTFFSFRQRLLQLYKKPKEVDIEKALRSLEDSTETLAGTFETWDVNTLNEIQLRELMGAIDALDLGGAKLVKEAEARVSHQKQALSLQPVQTLLWDIIGGPERLDAALRAKSAPTALKYQAENSTLINKRCREKKIVSIRGIYFASKNPDGSPRPQSLDDPYGHAGGCMEGVTCSMALSAASAGKDRVELVSVPRSGASGRATLEILRAYEVHRQLTLSPRFSQVLGVDDTTDSKSIHYMYDYARGITARELCEIGGPLRSSSPLFQFVVSEVLEAFIEFEERCTFGLQGKMTSSNVMVAEAGTSIRLCRLPLGDELSSFSNGRDVTLFHARRESDLVHAFGTIISELLHGPKGVAGHAPPMKGVGDDLDMDDETPSSTTTVYDREVVRAGVHAVPGEKFTILLDADTSQGYIWDIPVVLNNDRSTVPIVSYQGMDPRSGGGGSSMTTFAIQFCAVQTGSCTLQLVRKRPWDSSTSRQSAMTINVAVHERGMDPSYAAVLRACTEGHREKLEMLEAEGTKGKRRVVMTARRKLREPWQRQPTLRELRQHPLLSCSSARETPEVDQLITAFERHVDYM